VPDAVLLPEIRPADGDTERRAFIPLLGLLRAASGIKPADLQPVAPAFTAQQRLRCAKGNKPSGKLAQRGVVFG